jgi:hypothetical protein
MGGKPYILITSSRMIKAAFAWEKCYSAMESSKQVKNQQCRLQKSPEVSEQ